MGDRVEEATQRGVHVIDVGSVGHAKGGGQFLATHPLGSSLGVSIYDPGLHLGYLLHAVLPLSVVEPILAEQNPYLLVDTGVTAMFNEFFDAGGRRRRMQVKVAGCAVPLKADPAFFVGNRNLRVVERIFAKNQVQVDAHAVGGAQSRRMRLDLETGMVSLSSGPEEWEL